IRAPSARATKKGEPPTPRKARTGLLTPPGITRCALSNSLSDFAPAAGCWGRLTVEDFGLRFGLFAPAALIGHSPGLGSRPGRSRGGWAPRRRRRRPPLSPPRRRGPRRP